VPVFPVDGSDPNGFEASKAGPKCDDPSTNA
jgi:hypothetical protein